MNPTRKSLPTITGLVVAAVLLSACGEQESTVEPLVRGMKGFLVSDSANYQTRHYPSVVQPAQETKLSFEVGGQLKAVTLEVGQRVQSGELLVEIDPVELELKAQSAQATLDESKADYENSKSDYERKAQLLEQKYVTQSEFDAAENLLKSNLARVQRAERELELATEDASKSKLLAPFAGVISSVDVADFGQISAGQDILGLYSENEYEVAFTVPAAIINHLNIGDPAKIRFADLGDTAHRGRIKEIGTRAAQVSAFPVVVALDEKPEGLNAGIAADIELRISLLNDQEGYLAPLGSFSFDNSEQGKPIRTGEVERAHVFVYQRDSSTVERRSVDMAGIRDNMAIITSGLEEGDIIASAGVSYLADGQEVKLLPLEAN